VSAPPPSLARIGGIDVLASLVAAVAPRPLHARIEQLRLDARTIARNFSGERPAPVHDTREPREAPIPLAEIDPVEQLLPRPLAERYLTIRRDVRMVSNALQGKRPPPFHRREAAALRGGRTPAPAATLLAPRAVRVVKVVRETKDAVTLFFEDPTGAPFRFSPGQFLTLLVPIDGEVVRRAYSICTSALEKNRVAVTVKRVAGGLVSNYINDRIREGDTLEVLGPSGNFTVEPNPKAQRHLVLFAGGSGITPMMAIARTVLVLEPDTFITLVYGNRGRDDIIFFEAIEALRQEHGARFHVRHVLANLPEASDALGGAAFGAGLLTRDVCGRELDACTAPANREAEYFVCGPEPMMVEVRAMLEARGVAAEQIHEERFSQPHLRAKAAATASEPQPIRIRIQGKEQAVVAKPDATILEAGLAAKLAMPFSCAMGGCAACKVKIVSGDVEMEEPNCLSKKEREEGYVLACVARANSPCVVEVP
jgi:ring-1,2-phenylacetyl-CoA epoxidase subunit PaaE